MCGIAGIINFCGGPVEQSDLNKMTDAIAHRGPDGEGFFTDANVGFGHRRLSIIDLSSAAAQPMTRFGLTITYNGEIYNYIELRSELKNAGFHFETQSDTEVILAAYRHWGYECVERFNGMWAFAIYNATNQEVFLSRDRFGEKPLYYSVYKQCFFFCSEIKGLLTVLPFRKPDPVSIAQFLLHEQAEFASHTFFTDIFSIAAGHHCIINLQEKDFQHIHYYEPKASDKFSSLKTHEVLPLFAELLTKAVKLRLRSDVQVGSCLSGGLDSSAIVSAACSIYGKQGLTDFNVVSAGSVSRDKDELIFAKSVAVTTGVNQICVQPNESMLKRAIAPVYQAQESPLHSPSPLLQWLVFESAAANGLKVMLDGQGADELCMGYQSHLAWALHRRQIKGGIGDLIDIVDHYQIGLPGLLKLIVFAQRPEWKRKLQARRWPELKDEIAEKIQGGQQNPASALELKEFQIRELTIGTLPLLLRYEDKNAMAHSVETRLPFLDVDLAEFLLSVGMAGKINRGWSKYLIRQFVQDRLSKTIAWRKGKVGFDPGNFSHPEFLSSNLTEFLRTEVFKGNVPGNGLGHKGTDWRWKSLHQWYAMFFE